MSLPAWLEPIREGAASITAEDISRFVPPEGASTRKGAVLMLFGEGPTGPDLLLTERSHDMRSHPGQISFPGGSIDPADSGPVAAALREAEEETGLDPAGVEVFGRLPELWLPPSNFAVTAVLGWWADPTPVAVVDPGEVRTVLRVPLEELLDPRHRVTVTHPRGYRSPGWLIGDDKDLVLWGFTAGLINKLFDHVGLTRDWDATVEHPLPDYMLGVRQD
ncbi:NUDIX domain-containing protein [Nocardioides scoriae]|uniref:NUDIX domain-containing protein n=1 Tax=Nocardioides scoriae TaxID=642780 RepID=A0A1H1UF88_9ACTN|nr:CoA pyrophosphatase [Nocardioides scoriae]SDS71090.1 NUDIX domain-containing protein [Nocardioides scoriae]